MDDARVTEQTTAVLKELAFNECEAHLAPGKDGKKAESSISAYQLLGFGIQTLPNWEGEDLAS